MMNKVDVCRAPGVLPDADVVVLKPNPCFEVHTHNQNSLSAQSAKVNSPEKVCLRKKALDFYLKCRHLQFLRDSDFPRKLFRTRHLYGWAALLLLLGAGPATRPATTVYELRKQVEAMQSQIDDLKLQVESLRAEIQQIRSSVTTTSEKDLAADDPIAAAIKEKKLAIGMTLEQANKAMGRSGRLKYEDADGISMYLWSVPYEGVEAIPGTARVMTVTKYRDHGAKLSAGKIIAIVN